MAITFTAFGRLRNQIIKYPDLYIANLKAINRADKKGKLSTSQKNQLYELLKEKSSFSAYHYFQTHYLEEIISYLNFFKEHISFAKYKQSLPEQNKTENFKKLADFISDRELKLLIILEHAIDKLPKGKKKLSEGGIKASSEWDQVESLLTQVNNILNPHQSESLQTILKSEVTHLRKSKSTKYLLELRKENEIVEHISKFVPEHSLGHYKESKFLNSLLKIELPATGKVALALCHIILNPEIAIAQTKKMGTKQSLYHAKHDALLRQVRTPSINHKPNKRINWTFGISGTLIIGLAISIGVLKYQMHKSYKDTLPAFKVWAAQKMNLPVDQVVVQLDTIFAQIQNNPNKYKGYDSIATKLNKEIPAYIFQFETGFLKDITFTLDTLKKNHPDAYQNILLETLGDELGIRLAPNFRHHSIEYQTSNLLDSKSAKFFWKLDNDLTFFSLINRLNAAYGYKFTKKPRKNPSKLPNTHPDDSEKEIKTGYTDMAEWLTEDEWNHEVLSKTNYQKLSDEEDKLEMKITEVRASLQKKKTSEIKQLTKLRDTEISKTVISHRTRLPKVIPMEVLEYAKAKYLLKLMQSSDNKFPELEKEVSRLKDDPIVKSFIQKINEIKGAIHLSKQDIKASYQDKLILLNIKYKKIIDGALAPLNTQLNETSSKIKRIIRLAQYTRQEIKAKYYKILKSDTAQIGKRYRERFGLD